MTKNDGTVLPDTCQSVDWFFNSGKCQLSYGTSCDADPGNFNNNNNVNFYEKYCVCKLTTSSLADKEYDYDPGLPNTIIADYTDWITETLIA